jgi:hypothetical protein
MHLHLPQIVTELVQTVACPSPELRPARRGVTFRRE